jgi:hypothetical protein
MPSRPGLFRTKGAKEGSVGGWQEEMELQENFIGNMMGTAGECQ